MVLVNCTQISPMIKTAVLLIVALVLIPLIALRFDAPLSNLQREMITFSFLLMMAVALLCFVVSEITRNYSQVDKIWSIMPVVYAWYFAFASGWNDRIMLMAALITLWGIRLTINFGRKGAYSWKFWGGEEDYRWKVLREMPAFSNRWSWTLFNLFFISLYQNALILFFTLPMVAVASSDHDLGVADVLLAVLFLGFLAIETVADEQMWRFQREKKKRMQEGEKLTGRFESGFIVHGLWATVRHPNYAAEQAMWIVIYFFSVAGTGNWINWSMAGCVLLMLLFQGSSDFSESISASKYPAYKEYQKKVPRFIPRLWKNL
jgi:steroid 5-alpha reductase family enzyme